MVVVLGGVIKLLSTLDIMYVWGLDIDGRGVSNHTNNYHYRVYICESLTTGKTSLPCCCSCS